MSGAAREEIHKGNREPAVRPIRPVMLLPVIVVPRGAGTINARMAFLQPTAARSLTDYVDPITNQSRVTCLGSADRQWASSN
jgi:hypothetical protein